MNKRVGPLIVIALLLGVLHASAAENWPQWRGPANDGVAAEGAYPREFSTAEDAESLVWKVALPGRGCSTPAVWEDRILVTCGIDGHDGVVCYDFAGKELWRQQLGPERPGKHRNGSGSNPSPVTDGKHLVVYYKSGTVACLDLAGNVAWQANLQQKYGEDKLWWDLATSPVLAAGNAVIQVMNAGECYLVAFDLATGSLAWKQDRTYETPLECDQGYCSPSIYRRGGKETIVASGSDHVTGHDPRTGEKLWECGGMNPNNEQMWRMIGSLVITGDAAIAPYGRGSRLLKLQLEGSGDVTESQRLWDIDIEGSDVPTPVVSRDRIFLLVDKGRVTCLDLATGQPLWSADLPKSRHTYYASPVLAGNTLYCAREDGVVFSCEINEGLAIVAESNLGEQLIATPIPIRGQLLVRGSEHLFLFR